MPQNAGICAFCRLRQANTVIPEQDGVKAERCYYTSLAPLRGALLEGYPGWRPPGEAMVRPYRPYPALQAATATRSGGVMSCAMWRGKVQLAAFVRMHEGGIATRTATIPLRKRK